MKKGYFYLSLSCNSVLEDLSKSLMFYFITLIFFFFFLMSEFFTIEFPLKKKSAFLDHGVFPKQFTIFINNYQDMNT